MTVHHWPLKCPRADNWLECTGSSILGANNEGARLASDTVAADVTTDATHIYWHKSVGALTAGDRLVFMLQLTIHLLALRRTNFSVMAM